VKIDLKDSLLIDSPSYFLLSIPCHFAPEFIYVGIFTKSEANDVP
jgi:hypothetical protein